MTFGERLYYVMRRRKIKQVELARLVGCHSHSISQYTLDLHTPDANTICKLAEALEVPPDWLVLGRRIKTRPLSDDGHEE